MALRAILLHTTERDARIGPLESPAKSVGLTVSCAEPTKVNNNICIIADAPEASQMERDQYRAYSLDARLEIGLSLADPRQIRISTDENSP
jgi:hypothetical protein